jgi:ribonuclease E
VLMPIAPLLEGSDLVSGELPAFHNGGSEPPAVSRRPEPELVAVPMDADQETVYGWLGLNPILLLDQPPVGDNVVVRVVRPDADAEAVLEEARQQLASSGNRRRRGRSGRGSGSALAGAANGSFSPREPDTQEPEAPEERRPATVEITPLPLKLEPETIVTVSVPTRPQPESEPQPQAAAAVESDEDGQPRRRRRRSSAAS